MKCNVCFSLRKLSIGLVSVAFLFLACQVHASAHAATIASSGEEKQTVATVLLEPSSNSDPVGELTVQPIDSIIIQENVESQNTAEVLLEQPILNKQPTEGSPSDSIEAEEAQNQKLESVVNAVEVRSNELSDSAGEILEEEIEQPVSYYTTEDGQNREIVWAQGLTPPSMGQGGDFKKEVTGEFVEYSMPYEAGNGYYDANKSLDASLEDLNLCFAAVSSNMLHWWLEQNREYVNRFIQEKYGSNDSQQDYSLTDVRRYTNSFEDQQNSRIFNLFKAYYGHRLNGFVSDALVDLFINGYPPKSQGGVNLENPDLVPDKRGGFFYDVFKEKKLTDRMFSGDYHYFSELVRTNLENQGLLGLSYRTFGTTTHIVTVWGAEYDESGLIRAVYITDSDDQHHPIGLKRMGITRDSSGNPRLNNNVVKHSVGSYLDYVHTINLGQEHWQAYFNPIEEIRQEARQKLAEEKSNLLQAIQDQEAFSEEEQNTYSALIETIYVEVLGQINQVTDGQLLTQVLKSGLQNLQIPMYSIGQAVRHELPAGHISVHGDSVTHELPAGHISVHGDSVSHELPVGHISVHGDSVSHELPAGHISVHGSSVSHELPVGHISVHGSSVSHELPAGHISVHGSSVRHELSVVYPSLREDLNHNDMPQFVIEKTDERQAGQGLFSNSIDSSQTNSATIYRRPSVESAETVGARPSSSEVEQPVSDSDRPTSAAVSLEKGVTQVTQPASVPATESSQFEEQDKSGLQVLAKEFSKEEEKKIPFPYLTVISLLVIGLVSYWVLFFKRVRK